MHQFTVGFGLSPQESERLVDELRRTAALYPQLDHDAAWHRQLGNGVMVGGVGTPAAVAEPRRYVHDADTEIVLYDGLPIDPSGGIAAHRADELGRHWDTLPDRLEGRFGIVRVRTRPRVEIEVLNDALGVMQLYAVERGAMSVVSNSAGLLARALGARDEDPLGVSTFLTLDWVGADRTLRREVRVLPGAQRWTWRAGDAAWTKHRYWHYADADAPRRRVDEAFVDEVAGGLARITRAAAAITGSVNAPLTGGKDSRMLAAVLIGNGIPAQFWTKGLPESLDVRIALELADRYKLPHRLSGRPTEPPGTSPKPVIEEWEDRAWEFVSQNDGLPSLFLIGNIVGQPARMDRLAVTLSAMCAESARKAYDQEYLDAPGASLARALRYIPYQWAGIPRGLVSRDAYRLARGHIRETVQRLADEGVPLVNLSTAVYLDERCRRWAPNNPRELAQTEDKVLPFMSRSFVGPVLSTLPLERGTHQIHRRIIRALVPDMENHRLDKPWYERLEEVTAKRRAINEVMSRLPYPALRAVIATRDRLRPPHVAWEPWTPFDEASWLEAKLDWARDLALSRPGSAIWSYVDRGSFERLLDSRTDARERRLHQFPLFATLTMLLYEEVERRMAPA